MKEFIHSDLGLVLIAGLFTLLGACLAVLLTHIFEKNNQKKTNIQKELGKCQKEIGELRKKLDIYEAVEQSTTGDYLVQKESGMAICPICWPDRHKPIPIYEEGDTGKFVCSCCHHSGIFDKVKVQRINAENEADSKEFLCSIRAINQDQGDFYEGLMHRY